MSSPQSFDDVTRSNDRYLPTSLFFALQGVGPHVFVDREELRLRQTKSANGESFARYAADPGRYVPVHAFSPRVISQLTCEALVGLLPAEELQGLPSDDPRWGRLLLDRLDVSARALVKREFTAVLVRLAESWLAEMNLPSEGLILTAAAPRASAKDTSPAPPPPSRGHSRCAPRARPTPVQSGASGSPRQGLVFTPHCPKARRGADRAGRSRAASERRGVELAPCPSYPHPAAD